MSDKADFWSNTQTAHPRLIQMEVFSLIHPTSSNSDPKTPLENNHRTTTTRLRTEKYVPLRSAIENQPVRSSNTKSFNPPVPGHNKHVTQAHLFRFRTYHISVMEHEAETNTLDCILCTGDLETRQMPTSSKARRPQCVRVPLTDEALVSFSKLMVGVTQDSNTVTHSFGHSPYLRFCLKCTQKVERVHDIFTQIEVLRVQLAIFKDELEEELLRSYRKSSSGTWNRSTTLRHRIIRQLKLEPFLPTSSTTPNKQIARDPLSSTDSASTDTKVLEKKEDTEFVPSPQMDSDDLDYDTDSEAYADFGMHMEPPCITADCDSLTQAQENETLLECKLEFDQDDIQQVLESNEEEVVHHSYKLKPCRIQLGSRIDEKYSQTGTKSPRSQRKTNRDLNSTKQFRYPTGTTKNFPPRCPYPECSSTAVFRTVHKYRRHMSVHENPSSRSKLLPHSYANQFPKRCDFPGCTATTIFLNSSRYQRHMKVHAFSRVKTQSNPLYTVMEGLSYPAFCPVENCSSLTTYCDRRNLKKHIARTHLQLKRNALTVSELEAELDSCTYPTKCHIPGCENDLELANRDELRYHLRASHHVLRKPKQCRSALGRESSALTFPTTCPRLNCKSRTVFHLSDTLRQHLKAVHERPRKPRESTEPDGEQHICPICKLSFLSKLSLRHHSRVHEAPIVNATCEDCGAGFRSSTGLKVHRQTHHTLQSTLFLCTKCPKTFKTTQALEIHLQRHDGQKKYFCRICPKGFMFRMYLGEHERYAHWEELGLEQIKCHICNKIYSQTRTLRSHMSSHTGEQRFCCTECEYKTDYRNDLAEHEATVHQTDFSFPCTECDKSFKLERRLRQHMLEHTEEATSCEVCSKRFASRRTLRIHNERKHGAQPPGREYKEGVIAEFDV